MARKLWTRESAGLFLTAQLTNAAGVAVDMTGWTLAMSLARQAGSIDVTLGMALSSAADVDGFYLTDAAAGTYTICISADTLTAIADSTADFTMIGDEIATVPGGARLWIEDFEVQVTEGVTA